jgi:hypothetical protein
LASQLEAGTRQQQDWILMCMQGGRAHHLADCGVATLCCSPPGAAGNRILASCFAKPMCPRRPPASPHTPLQTRVHCQSMCSLHRRCPQDAPQPLRAAPSSCSIAHAVYLSAMSGAYLAERGHPNNSSGCLSDVSHCRARLVCPRVSGVSQNDPRPGSIHRECSPRSTRCASGS